MSNPRCCAACEWYAAYEGVCCNGDSEQCADFVLPEDSCRCWEPKSGGE